MSVPLSELPCSGLGAVPDMPTTLTTMAFLVPTHTFSGETTFKVSH
jgi:hypothetical protein